MEIKNYISTEREQTDINYLTETIKQDKWIGEQTIIVNCSPEYSSRLVHMLNHRLSHLNNNELYEVINMEIPKRHMVQVWDQYTAEFRMFDRYLNDWMRQYAVKDFKYLFVINSIFSGKAMGKLKTIARIKGIDFKIACLYVSDYTAVHPDYTQKMFKDEPLFFWENLNKQLK